MVPWQIYGRLLQAIAKQVPRRGILCQRLTMGGHVIGNQVYAREGLTIKGELDDRGRAKTGDGVAIAEGVTLVVS